MADEVEKFAPGWPGIPPRWTSSAKSGLGTALRHSSRVWFTISHGILNEVYYPRVDQACTRDLGFVVTDGYGFFSEEKRHTDNQVNYLAPGVPAFRLINTDKSRRYVITKDVVSDPHRNVVLQRIRFEALQGKISDYHLYALLSPHIANNGSGNTAWVDTYKTVQCLFAQRKGVGLALACSEPWVKCSAGFVGVSDGWQDLVRNHELTQLYQRAENGNVALIGEINLNGDGVFVLALAFGHTPEEAALHAAASLNDGFEASRNEYLRGWKEWQDQLLALDGHPAPPDIYRVSTSVMRVHEEKDFPGAIIASLSIPWGFNKGDEDLGGYHLVWPRDLVENAGGLLAIGAAKDATRVLNYLQVTQEEAGYWPQNMWIDGAPYWHGTQMDETAFPILLADLARRTEAVPDGCISRYWPMVKKAAGFLVCNGPVTQQDRWEEDPGYSPFTLAVEIAALLAAADIAEVSGERPLAKYLRETADAWNACVERWTYVTDTELARKVGVEGYYVRIAPPDSADCTAPSPMHGFVPIKNRPIGQSSAPTELIVSPDSLALVRFGIRAPNDPRILNTIKVVDALLKKTLPQGDFWYRYNGDGYGEHEDGSAFDGSGIGRLWPLLTGERAHYELTAGNRERAEELMRAVESAADEGGLLPEQIWDAPDIPGLELFLGKATGSAKPLVWAHAEYVKLRRSLRDGKIFDQPPQTVERYVTKRQQSQYTVWRFNNKRRDIPQGQILRLEALAPFMSHWGSDGWNAARDSNCRSTGIGIFVADLPTQTLPRGTVINFTFYWPEAGHWEGADYTVSVV
ncbi:MAG TPA: glucan 1,4-alpha-glucosidase [Terriglobales bacterium]|nr:glucan 1,4-alpha-glucosidase [Terriglobales bacterium]